MVLAEIQALCDAMGGAVMAVDSTGQVIAANDRARERAPVLNGQLVHDGPAVEAHCEALSVAKVFDPGLEASVSKMLNAMSSGDVRTSAIDARIVELPCEGARVALVMERPASARGDGLEARDAGLDVLAMLAHDLRGALSNVCGAFALLDEDLADDLTHGPRVAAMRGALTHFSDLIGAALDVEALSAGKISIKSKDIDLRDFAENTRSIWSSKFAEIGAQLHLEVSADAPAKIRIDPMRFRQIVFNLLANAEAHSCAKNVRISFASADDESHRDECFSVLVEDDGVGLPDHVLARMQDESARTLYGEGRRRLGLSVVQDVAKAVGGGVTCRNRDRGGARIVVSVPIGEARAASTAGLSYDAAAAASSARHSAPSASEGLAKALAKGGVRGLKALLAEDNATNQLVATQMLDKLGCVADVASDGVEAVEMLSKGGYDFLLVDIEMPKMSGIDVLRRLRSGQAGPSELPAIALTAYAMAEHRRKVADAGSDGMIAKPILGVKSFESDLVEILGRVLKSRGAVRPDDGRIKVSSDVVRATGNLRDPDIDLEVFDSLIGVIGEDSSLEFLERVETDLADVRLRIRNGARKGDLEEIRAGAHILISVAGAIGAHALQSAAQSLHACAAEGSLENARAIIRDGDPEFMAVTAFIYRRRAGAPQRDL